MGEMEPLAMKLLAAGAGINACAHNGETLLHMVCRCGLTDDAGKLPDKGADVNACPLRGKTPLKFARENMVKLLPEYGATE